MNRVYQPPARKSSFYSILNIMQETPTIINTNNDIKEKRSTRTSSILGRGNRYLKWFILGGIPFIFFFVILIFTLTKVPTQTIAAAIPIFIVGLVLFIYAAVIFVRIARLLLSDSKQTKKKMYKQLSTKTSEEKQQQQQQQNDTEEREDDIKKTVNIISLVEILLTSYYGLILMCYSTFLFNNEQFTNTLEDLDASLVSSTATHFEIMWIFIFYVALAGIGTGFTRYIPTKFWGELITLVISTWVTMLLVAFVSLILGELNKRRTRAKKASKKDVVQSEISKYQQLNVT